MSINRLIKSLIIAMLVPVSLSGCVSLAGSQARIVDPRTEDGGLPGLSVRAALRAFAYGNANERGNRSQREFRDYVVTVYLAAIEANYQEFGGRVSSERRELGLGLDLVASSFTTYATVASTAIVNDLSAAAAGFAGARGALDRNVYFDRTVPALLASMDAQRARIRARIAEGIRQSEADYTLAAAFDDLSLLESAGSLDRALVSVTGQAAGERDRAERELASAVRACTAQADAVAPARRLSNYLRALATPDGSGAVPPANVTELRLVATTMQIAPGGDPDSLLDAMLDRIVEGTQGRCAGADIEALITRIEQLTGKDI